MLTRATLLAILGLPEPKDAAAVARARLVVQLVTKAPREVFDLFDAAWNRALPWCEILADSVRQVSEALPAGSYSAASISYVRQHAPALLKACRRLSRWGTLLRAVWLLWGDVVTPRAKLVVGTPHACSCPLCHLLLPSAHALAAHLHRRHTIVNVLTKFTQGTVCLWCHCEHHTTDRLKYHLRVSPACVHGLRVTVGETYIYGSGTKRSGQRTHRGLPSFRLPGPINATPAQRRASLENRVCSEADLAAELHAATGSADVFQWPAVARLDGDPAPAALPSANSPVLAPVLTLAGDPSSKSPSSSAPGRWFTLIDPSQVSVSDACTPSAYWPGLLSGSFVCQLPASWHHYWRLWQAMHSRGPWDPQSFSAAAVLRRAATTVPDPTSKGPAVSLLDFLSATVSLRTICDALLDRGLLWICGVPSRVGLVLLRSLLPQAHFHVLSLSSFRVFVIGHQAHPPSSWRSALCDLLSHHPGVSSPRVLSVRSSLVYRTRSLVGG